MTERDRIAAELWGTPNLSDATVVADLILAERERVREKCEAMLRNECCKDRCHHAECHAIKEMIARLRALDLSEGK